MEGGQLPVGGSCQCPRRRRRQGGLLPGLDTARVILGHRSPIVTEIYAEMDREKAIEAMPRVG